jgi:predicted RNA-binding Zn ribbon-like protein
MSFHGNDARLVKCTLMDATVDGPPRPLPVVGGHLALDFGNTVDDPLGPDRWDHIADYDALLAWSVEVAGMSTETAAALARRSRAHPSRTARVVQGAAGLRSSINELFGAIVDRRSPATGWAQLRPFLSSAMAHADVVTEAGSVTLAWDEDLEAPLWPVADSAYRLLTGAQLPRVKRCVGCPWLFLDQSKNHSRRWCSMAICGTSEKVSRTAARRRRGG